MTRFAIFTGGRMGSTTLMNALNKLPEISIFSEPFSAGLEGVCEPVDRAEYIESRIREIFEEHNAIKHCWNQLGREANQILLTTLKGFDAKILFLHRRNLLQPLVSLLLSEQSGVWHKPYIDQPDVRFESGAFEALDVGLLKEMVDYERESIPFYRASFERLGLAFHEIIYESLFALDLDFDEKLRVVEAAARFIDPEIAVAPHRAELEILLAPEGKLSDPGRYRRIPNLPEIMETFGVDDSLEPVPGSEYANELHAVGMEPNR